MWFHRLRHPRKKSKKTSKVRRFEGGKNADENKFKGHHEFHEECGYQECFMKSRVAKKWTRKDVFTLIRKRHGRAQEWRSSTPKSLVLRAKNGYRKFKKMAYVSLSVNVTIINHFLRAKNGYVARKLKKMAYVSLAIITPSKSLVLRAKNSYVARKLKMAYVSLSVNVTIIIQPLQSRWF